MRRNWDSTVVVLVLALQTEIDAKYRRPQAA
jgi:hypothetical protein